MRFTDVELGEEYLDEKEALQQWLEEEEVAEAFQEWLEEEAMAEALQKLEE